MAAHKALQSASVIFKSEPLIIVKGKQRFLKLAPFSLFYFIWVYLKGWEELEEDKWGA